ncbi:MAG TPA: UDP-N-acetylmuramate--L-alanine ligase [Anaerolineae bacterium]|nr:UDP-N-acetylmuramate--L-alanine ligase [Anaerolineae bacterium]
MKPVILLPPNARLHIIGIGGAGMSAIAIVLMERGYQVSGSDQSESEVTRRLSDQGARVFIGHRAENVGEVDMVIASSAVHEDNLEFAAARSRGIPVSKRAQFLSWLMQGSLGVAIAGTHGKTTTTAMITQILLGAGRDPSFIVGGTIGAIGKSAHAGRDREFVIEADEYDRTFLGITPTIAIITNIEHDHPDYYPTFDDVLAAFRSFIKLLPADGLLVVCGEDVPATKLASSAPRKIVYGFDSKFDWYATDVRPNNAGGNDFLAYHQGESLGLVRLRVPGEHNVLNALAALAATDRLGVPFGAAQDALSEFRGVGRRFEVRGEVKGVTIVDDYGHHPTEIKATLAGARQRYPDRAIWAVFQPHTYSRTKTLLDQFAAAFVDADHVIVTAIYAAREKDTLGISTADVVRSLDHTDARAIDALTDAVEYLRAHTKEGDVVITFSAGDANKISTEMINEQVTVNNDE